MKMLCSSRAKQPVLYIVSECAILNYCVNPECISDVDNVFKLVLYLFKSQVEMRNVTRVFLFNLLNFIHLVYTKIKLLNLNEDEILWTIFYIINICIYIFTIRYVY